MELWWPSLGPTARSSRTSRDEWGTQSCGDAERLKLMGGPAAGSPLRKAGGMWEIPNHIKKNLDAQTRGSISDTD